MIRISWIHLNSVDIIRISRIYPRSVDIIRILWILSALCGYYRSWPHYELSISQWLSCSSQFCSGREYCYRLHYKLLSTYLVMSILYLAFYSSSESDWCNVTIIYTSILSSLLSHTSIWRYHTSVIEFIKYLFFSMGNVLGVTSGWLTPHLLYNTLVGYIWRS